MIEPPSDDYSDWDDDSDWPDTSDPDTSSGAPDFRIDSVTGPSDLGATSQKVQARVCNGGSDFGLTEVSFYLSADRFVDPTDRLLTTSSRGGLLAGECADVWAWVTAPSISEGRYTLVAEVDPAFLMHEDNEDDNQRAGGFVRVDRTPPQTPVPAWAENGTTDGHALTVETEAGATVRVYSGPGCTGTEVANTTVDMGAYCEVPISVPSNTSSGTYSVRAYDAAGNGSSCSPTMEYPYGGGTGGTTPVLLRTRPGSPGLSLQPIFDGRASPRATVELFQRADCEGPVDAVVTADSTGAFSFQGTVAKDAKLTLSARAKDASGYGQDSACSNPLEYQNDTTPPPGPVIIDTKWQYTSTGRQLTVTGTAEPGSTVGIFIDVACTGTPAKTVQADAEGRFSATMPFALGNSHRVFVAARDALGNESTCTEGPAYEVRCPAGTADCDGKSTNGCEVDLTTDEDHCGACGTTCQDNDYAQGVCQAATCGNTCEPGYYDCDGNVANGCESTYACQSTACTIDRPSELMVTALSVVEDPVRTAPGGAWHFGTLMKAMANGQDPSPMVRAWLKTWQTKQVVNGLDLPARQEMQTKVLGPWEQRSGGASRPLDFSKAPFRLLAIVNRMDLRQSGVQAGEGRFVFGVLDANGAPLEFTIILEYALPGGTNADIQTWANDWHALGKVGSAGYNAKLQALTDRFAKAGVMTGRQAGNALNQIRTNEITLAEPWEMREFNLTAQGLMPATVKLTPAMHFENTAALASYIQQNQADIIAERHTVPNSLNGNPFLGAMARTPLDFFWRAPGVNTEARHKFSMNTCSGCHSGETQTEFLHVAPRVAGKAAVLSPYLKGTTVTDPVTHATRVFDDLGRRADDLKALVCPSATQLKSGGLAPSNLPPARVH
ncbi:Ig-like domain-containing protein [Pyxidicoccus sp. MSG2]|uniref:Ig-like domain-containing protein n=1 Tax=Pyxidicoccus sp. MSG2 TaxID=2996790 RepID=UPI0022710B9A|nr:Ig-like domain-containing protein [Pyxidicoccus sp. MSG2]MCY1018620.1 Ig-like domain-containing protein [Pyxidicoccus sp. MSG2]